MSLSSFCMTVALGSELVSWCHEVLLSLRSMDLTNFCVIPVLLVHVCSPSLAQTEDSLIGEIKDNKQPLTKPLVKSITSIQILVVILK